MACRRPRTSPCATRATARCRRRHRPSAAAPRRAVSRHSRRRSPRPCRCPSRSRARSGRPGATFFCTDSVIFSGLPMVPAGKIWNLTLPPVNASACLAKPCAKCSRCGPPGQDVAVRMFCWALAVLAARASTAAALAMARCSCFIYSSLIVTACASDPRPTITHQTASLSGLYDLTLYFRSMWAASTRLAKDYRPGRATASVPTSRSARSFPRRSPERFRPHRDPWPASRPARS